MEWVVTFLMFLLGFLGNSRGSNPMLLAYKDELKDFNFRTTNVVDVSKEVFFYLYTKTKTWNYNDGSDTKQELIPNSVTILHSSYFDPKRPTKIIIHGFFSSSKKRMEQLLKNRLLQVEDVNVILVDWSKISMGIDYITISSMTPHVGAYIAEMIDFLVENGANLDDFHLIGHSLGAHVAGFAGANLKNGTIARITGLDPAKPGFHKVPAEKRLNPNNAKFVDCIHTCGGILGLKEAICTSDFYPNGGKNMQPGCPFYDFGRCSHERSYEYFAESIDPHHKFSTKSCVSVQDELKCVPSSVKMGYYASASVNGVFYGVTNKKSPFAIVTEDAIRR